MCIRDRVRWPNLPPSLKTLRLFVHELRVITVPVDQHWKCERGHCACAESRHPWIGVFKSNAQHIKTFILTKVLQRFQPNLTKLQRPASSLRGWSQYAPDKSKMAERRHFEKNPLNRHISANVWKIRKMRYHTNGLTDLREIWPRTVAVHGGSRDQTCYQVWRPYAYQFLIYES